MSGRTPRPSRLARGGQHHRSRPEASRSNQPAVPSSRVPRPPALLPSRPRRPVQRRPRQPQVDVPLWPTDQLTDGEMEDLFLRSLATGLPENFVLTSQMASVWLLPRMASLAEVAAEQQPLVLGSRSGSRSGSSYWELFGSWSETTGYGEGLIVTTLRRLEPQLNPAAAPYIGRAREFLLEAIVARRERLSAAATDVWRQQRGVYEVRVMAGTLRYLGGLRERLAQRAAAAASAHWSQISCNKGSEVTNVWTLTQTYELLCLLV